MPPPPKRPISKTSTRIMPAKKVTVDPKVAQKRDALVIPAFSIAQKINFTQRDMERLKQKTIRRNAPKGEDLKGMKNVLKNIKGQSITLPEFIALISQYTADNGDALRSVATEDMATFRRLTTKIYETITQDTSDVLINQQLQLSEFYKEQEQILRHKTMKAITNILEMAPNFNFQEFYKNKGKYLAKLFPIPAELQVEPEEIEAQKRQKIYHRLQWLRTEGERLNEENAKLQGKLTELKREYKNEQMKAAQIEEQIEEQKEQLEVVESQKQDQLDELNQSIEKNIIIEEANERLELQRKILTSKPPKGAKKGGMVKKPRPPWNESTAVDVESQILEESKQLEITKLSVKSAGSKSRMKRVKKKLFESAEPPSVPPPPKEPPEIPTIVNTTKETVTKTKTDPRKWKGG